MLTTRERRLGRHAAGDGLNADFLTILLLAYAGAAGRSLVVKPPLENQANTNEGKGRNGENRYNME